MSDQAMEEMLRSSTDLFESSCLISCVPTAADLPDHTHWLRLSFADVDAGVNRMEALLNLMPGLERYRNMGDRAIFDHILANRVIDFILDHHAKPQQVVLFVNCAMGVSRSG